MEVSGQLHASAALLPRKAPAQPLHKNIVSNNNNKFPDRWIGRGGTQNWPPRSPDLNPSDYHVWGYMKAMVCAHKVNSREELRVLR